MEKGICNYTVLALRATPSDKSEMVSQLLYGDSYQIIEEETNYFRIRTDFDAYEGWLDKKQHVALTDSRQVSEVFFVSEAVCVHKTPEGLSKIFSFGSIISAREKLQMSDIKTMKFSTNFDGDKMVEHAKKLLGVPYLWGGKSAFGIDCSGLVQLCAKATGKRLFRDASMQATQGEMIDFLQEAQAGDLAFFENKEGAIVHVGIVMSNQEIIHASGMVRIDLLDQSGIYNRAMKRHTHKLRFIKRISEIERI
ncbi:MAG: C40 family peptidase [Lentimicrobiaceae bacterium]|jgi:cell wall-associated NlpC family hydrolase|nr:C40 family peptidase [Lentimicrobiaceae bacterium]